MHGGRCRGQGGPAVGQQPEETRHVSSRQRRADKGQPCALSLWRVWGVKGCRPPREMESCLEKLWRVRAVLKDFGFICKILILPRRKAT